MLPLEAANEVSPAKLALIPVAYVPASMPDRLTFESVATPLLSVVVLPTELPFTVNAMDLLATGDPPQLSVAESAVVPPYVPAAVATDKLVLALLTINITGFVLSLEETEFLS